MVVFLIFCKKLRSWLNAGGDEKEAITVSKLAVLVAWMLVAGLFARRSRASVVPVDGPALIQVRRFKVVVHA